MSSTTLTPRDIELLLVALASTRTEFSIDYEKFAQGAGLKNKHTAQVIWTGVKKKLNAMREGGVKVAASPGKVGETTPKTGSAKGKKRKAAAESDDVESPLASKLAKRGKETESASPVMKDEEIAKSMEVNGDGGEGVKSEPQD